jgi:hypothetical protein
VAYTAGVRRQRGRGSSRALRMSRALTVVACSLVLSFGLSSAILQSVGTSSLTGASELSWLTPVDSLPASHTPCPPVCSVTILESGLPAGTTWSVDQDGKSINMSSNTNQIVFYDTNGTYNFTVGAVSGYTASPSSGQYTVNGSALTIGITFTPNPVFLGLSSLEVLLLLGGLVVGLLIGIGIGYMARARRNTPPPAAPVNPPAGGGT